MFLEIVVRYGLPRIQYSRILDNVSKASTHTFSHQICFIYHVLLFSHLSFPRSDRSTCIVSTILPPLARAFTITGDLPVGGTCSDCTYILLSNATLLNS